MAAVVNYVGRKAGRWYWVPGRYRERFRAQGGRTQRRATEEETAAALVSRSGGMTPIPLSALQPPPPAGKPSDDAEAGAGELGLDLETQPKPKRGKRKGA